LLARILHKWRAVRCSLRSVIRGCQKGAYSAFVRFFALGMMTIAAMLNLLRDGLTLLLAFAV